jgi:hypothetical protein
MQLKEKKLKFRVSSFNDNFPFYNPFSFPSHRQCSLAVVPRWRMSAVVAALPAKLALQQGGN